LKSKKKNTLVVKRTPLACCLEAVTEYCRLCFDLLDDNEIQISVVAANVEAKVLNTWSEQTLNSIVPKFETIVETNNNNLNDLTTSLFRGLEVSVRSLGEPISSVSVDEIEVGALPNHSYKTCIICIYQQQEKVTPKHYQKMNGEIVNIPSFVQQLISRQNEASKVNYEIQPIDKCELILIAVVNENQKPQFLPRSSICPFLHCVYYSVTPSTLRNALIDLAVYQYNLFSITVNEIPFKEKDETPQNVNYDVVLLYKRESTLTQRKVDSLCYPSVLGTSSWRQNRNIFLRWYSPKQKPHIARLSTRTIHKISPFQVASLPSVCLMKHICANQKPVCLTYENKSQKHNVISHMLIQHSNDGPVFLHTLHTSSQLLTSYITSRNDMDNDDERKYGFGSLLDLPFVDIYTNSSQLLENCRVKELADVAEHCIFTVSDAQLASAQRCEITLYTEPNNCNQNEITKEQHSDAISPVGPKYVTTKILERFTRFFPISDKSTVLFAARQSEYLRSLLHPLKISLVNETISDSEVNSIFESIDRLYTVMSSNEVKFFPWTKSSAATRRQLYTQLWKEIRHWAYLCRDISPQHVKILNHIDNISNNNNVKDDDNNSNATPSTNGNLGEDAKSMTLSSVQSNSMEGCNGPSSSVPTAATVTTANLTVPTSSSSQRKDSSSGEHDKYLDMFVHEMTNVREDLRFKNDFAVPNVTKDSHQTLHKRQLESCDETENKNRLLNESTNIFTLYWNACAEKKQKISLF